LRSALRTQQIAQVVAGGRGRDRRLRARLAGMGHARPRHRLGLGRGRGGCRFDLGLGGAVGAVLQAGDRLAGLAPHPVGLGFQLHVDPRGLDRLRTRRRLALALSVALRLLQRLHDLIEETHG